MKRSAVFPGTFDPFTLGHDSVIRKALPLFDRIIIGIGKNSTKNALFSLEERTNWIKAHYENEPSIEVLAFDGLTVEFCRKNNCAYIVRGLRNALDFHYESSIAQMNQSMAPDVATVFVPCDAAYSPINSTIVREIYKNGGDISAFVPMSIVKNLR